MRTTERLRKLRDFCYENLCRGREMKTPAPDGDVTRILRQEPKCYIGFYPTRPDLNAGAPPEPVNTAPSILLMPAGGNVKSQEEQRWDRYGGVHRPKEMGQSLDIQALFTVYEDGVRLPGFVDAAEQGEFDVSLIREGTDEGLMTLINWMDDFNDLLLSSKFIPGTDLFINETTMQYGMYTDQKFISDTRPLYIGICTLTFQCHADEFNPQINDLLK